MSPSDSSKRATSLAAVIFVTRSRPGPKLVFHYPPDPQLAAKKASTGEDSLDSDNDSDSDNGNQRLPTRSKVSFEVDTESPLSNAGAKKTSPPLGSIFGYSEETLERLLAPESWSDRKKFEICLDGLTFVSYPMFDRDGSWNAKRTAKASGPNAENDTSTESHATILDAQTKPGINIIEPSTPAKPVYDFTHVPESLDSRAGTSLGTSVNSGSSTSAFLTPEPLMMFNIVFVLSNAQQEDVSQIYHHVAKKLSKALNYCQKQDRYVAMQSQYLLSLKASAHHERTDAIAINDRMIENGGLGWVLKEIYVKLSNGEIAAFRLNGIDMSLQIPPASSSENFESNLKPHSGLLLLEEKPSLLRELAHPEASPLAYFIREHTPNKSLRKLATKIGLPIDDVLYLAHHLIKWRKAHAITPLHPRNTYIVGPKAPLERLDVLITEYSSKFSALPSLPQMLRYLGGGRPLKFGFLIPSRDHREPYMEILAYLVRYKFVEQLKTFGWLQAPPMTSKPRRAETHETNINRRPLSVASLLSPQLRPVSDDDSISVSSERTAIPVSVADAAKKRLNELSPVTTVLDADTNDTPAVQLILNPLSPSTEEARCLEHIREHIEDEELAERLDTLLPHFDGEHAFEEIAAREGLKRSSVESWLDSLQRDGWLVSFRSL